MSSADPLKRAEYLCYCTETREGEFVERIEERDFRSFAELCQETGVGMHCTACVLGAEQLYLQTVGGHRPGVVPAQPSRSGSRGPRLGLGRLLRKLSPVMANRMHSVCPVLCGNGLRTVLCVSNPGHPKIDAVIRPVRVDVTLRDPAGKMRARFKRKVQPEAHLECDLSMPFQDFTGAAPAFGSATVTLRAQGQSHQGAIRPHFKFVMANATSAVHTVKTSGRESHLLFTAPDAAQRSFVFIRNMADGEIDYCVSVGGESGAGLFTAKSALASEGCALVEIPELTNAEERLSLHVGTSDQHRAFFLTGNSDLTRLSADHI